MLKITKNPRSTGSNEGSQICGLGISTGLDNRVEVRKVEATSDWEGKWEGKPRKRKCRDVGHGQQFKRYGGKDRVEKKKIHSRNGPRHPWLLSSLGLALCLFDSQVEFFFFPQLPSCHLSDKFVGTEHTWITEVRIFYLLHSFQLKASPQNSSVILRIAFCF